MRMQQVHNIETLSPNASVIISIALILLSGFLFTRITKLFKLPDVTTYILTGIILGPYFFNLVPSSFVKGTEFLPDLALSFIAFSTGQFFRMENLKKSGISVLLITVCEALAAFVLVFILTFFILRLSFPFAIVLSALATATAPASTMMTIRQTKAHGEFVDTLLQVVALDDVVGLLAYSIAVAIASSVLSGNSFEISDILTPIITNLAAILLGVVFGALLKLFIQDRQSSDNRLIIAIAMIFGYCGICTLFDISPLLGCMMMATVYINWTDDDRLFKQLNYFSPPILLLFFVRSGVNFDLGALFQGQESVGDFPLVLIGVLYFITRIIGKYAGSFLGCLWMKKPDNVKNYLGFALFPQAGVAIGLAALGARILGGDAGNALNTIILSSSILYELVGPACAKAALSLSGSYSDKLEDITSVEETTEEGKEKTSLELLIERIHQIQETLPDYNVNEDERAYDSDLDDSYNNYYPNNKRR
ncbi:MAG: cation:proton antiporter [Erysipelotrichaceae bacterium]|nr:cation:proton antiporter [Erysipelotrichaceae bacterium]